jgi:alkaline phosphatase D
MIYFWWAVCNEIRVQNAAKICCEGNVSNRTNKKKLNRAGGYIYLSGHFLALQNVHTMQKRYFFGLIALIAQITLAAQAKYLQSGPMVGYADMKEVLLWAQTKERATVQFEYWPLDTPKNIYKTRKIKTHAKDGFTAKLVANQVEPGTKYGYQLRINNKKVALPYATTFATQTLWQWRTDPPAFTVAAGSCAYVNETPYDRPGKPYGSEYGIFQSIADKKPDMMLWLGDNMYLREADWATRTGILHRYTHTRSLPEMQPLLASTPNYATWDDHDFGPNDADRTWVHKQTSLAVFKAFWGNPTYGIEGEPSVATAFKFNDVDFILLDNRYHRTPNYCKTCPDKTQLGGTQLQWFLESLVASTAPFKIVALGGQFLTSSENSETYTHHYKEERAAILKFIEENDIKNVVFLDGDRHFTELSKMTNAKGNVIYDMTTSSLTAGAYADGPTKDPNTFRVEGTGVGVHNFATLHFSGPRKERVLEIKVFDTTGKELWTQRIDSQK